MSHSHQDQPPNLQKCAAMHGALRSQRALAAGTDPFAAANVARMFSGVPIPHNSQFE